MQFHLPEVSRSEGLVGESLKGSLHGLVERVRLIREN